MIPVALLGARRVSPRCCACLLANSSSLTTPAARSATKSLPLPIRKRQTVTPASCRFFRASASFRADVEATKRQNHYERLGVRHDASQGEIKKSFYRLSKTHHPDINPSNPSASAMFSLLSESYTLLSDPTRRATYDRDVLRLHQSISSSSGAHPRGSYSSTQAGGRSPSGLSRRRTTFRGPPPSFYRSGGWGTQSEKRQRAHDESTGGSGANTSSTHSQDHSPFYRDSEGAAGRDRHAGMGPGSDPFSHAFARDAPHFDTGSHKRTQEREDVRRSSRRRRRAVGDDDVEFEPQTSLVGHFLIVSGILAVTFLAPFLYLQTVGKKRRKRDSLG